MGAVVHAESRQALEGANVRVSSIDGVGAASGETASDGSFRIGPILPDEFEFTTSLYNFEYHQETITYAWDTPFEPIDVVLIPKWESVVLGRVVDGDGRPVVGAMVEGRAVSSNNPERSSSIFSARANTFGVFRMNVDKGIDTVVLGARHLRYALPEPDGMTVSIDDEDIVLRLVPEAIVEGTVVDENGEAIADYHVVAYPKGENPFGSGSDTTLVNGAFQLGHLAAGDYSLKASGDSRNHDKWVLAESPEFTLEAGQILKDLRVVLTTPGDAYIDGIVVDQEGEPRPYVTVMIYSNVRNMSRNIQLLTDENGKFRADNLAPVEYRIQGIYNRFIDDELRGTAPANNVRTVFADMPILVGRVIDADTNRPVTTFHAEAAIAPRYVRNNFQTEHEDGKSELPQPTLTAGHVVLLAQGYQAFSAPIGDLESGQKTKEYVFRLQPGWELAGRVINEIGEPIANARVFIGYGSNREVADRATGGSTDEDGVFRLTNVKPNARRVSAIFGDYAPATASLDHFDGTLVLREPGQVEGYVTQNGEPLVGVSIGVRPHNEDRTLFEGTTDVDGFYHIEGVALGGAKITLNSNRANFARRAIIASGMVTQVDFAVLDRTGRITGRVTLDGVPRGNALINYEGEWDGVPASGTVTQNLDAQTGTASISGRVTGTRSNHLTYLRVLEGHHEMPELTMENYRKFGALALVYERYPGDADFELRRLKPGEYTILVTSVDSEYTGHVPTALEHAEFKIDYFTLGEDEDLVINAVAP